MEHACRLGMGVYRFEDLRVWQAAQKQCVLVGELIKRPELRRDRKMVDQMNDASISVSFNISEGFLRRRDRETAQFLRYSFASNGELKAAYYACDGRKYIEPAEIADLIELNESIAKMLRRWLATLDVSENRMPGGRRTRTKDQGRTKHQELRTKDQTRANETDSQNWRGARRCVIHSVLRLGVIVHVSIVFALAAPAAARAQTARELTSGAAIYQAGCAGCHGPNGEGAPHASTAFDRPSTFPDFSDCATTTPELDVDWRATIAQGGHGRGFSHIMPSFAEELTAAQIDAVIAHLRSLCRERSWPRGELNLPRPLRTEKAFPESETVYTMAFSSHRSPDVDSELAYEQRLSKRDQLEVAVPFGSVHDESGTRVGGVGDVALGWKRVFLSSRNSIVSGQGEIVFPTGNTSKALGSGVTTLGAFASYGQVLPASAFVQFQIGTDQPTSTDETPRTIFWRAAAGRSLRQDRGVGRMWSPMFEVVSEREFASGASADIDLVPQVQVTLNRRQHVRINFGVQIPATNTQGRSRQFVFYFLWDWFDGGLLEGWR